MDNKIIGREEEQLELKDIFNSQRSEFVAVYGRRRVGKTYLIKSYFRKTNCVYFQVIGLQNGTMQEQLEIFSESLSETFYDGVDMKTPINWKEALKLLTTCIKNQSGKRKVILFFDELPWLTTPRSGLLQALDYFWNKIWVDMHNLKLFVCGSSASWIMKKIIYNKGGLHNRVTRQILVRPFLIKDTKSYLLDMGCKFNSTQILELYMAIGGIPFYLNGIKKHLSATQNINNLCFRSDGILFNEFDKLFSSLFKKADAYVELIKLIAARHYGISRPELEDKCKLSEKGGTLTQRLKELEDAGFILSFLPMDHINRGVYYKVIDEYSLFYLSWIATEKDSLLKIKRNSNFWKLKHNTATWHAWAGYSFEAVCYKHVELIARSLDIPESSRTVVWKYVPQKSSNEQGAQIDLIFDRDDDCITLCEIKYTNEPFTISKDYAKRLLTKKEVFVKHTKTKKQIFMAIITANGLKENLYSDGLIDGVVSLDDIC